MTQKVRVSDGVKRISPSIGIFHLKKDEICLNFTLNKADAEVYEFLQMLPELF